ncbi:hypothetical protein KCU78_g1593, partial [Aureobasidium melanogenum]
MALHPVVCAAQLTKEWQVMDRFIVDSGYEEDWWECVFVDSISHCYDEISETPVESDSDPNSPFIGKTPEECHRLLLKLREDTESEIPTDFFMIMDEKSIQDDTVLLVSVTGEEDEQTGIRDLLTLRATFEVSAKELMLYSIGHWTIEEDAERAVEQGDSVYRG